MKGVSGGDIKDTRVIKLYKAKRSIHLAVTTSYPLPKYFEVRQQHRETKTMSRLRGEGGGKKESRDGRVA